MVLINSSWLKLAEVVVDKPWGREDWLVNTSDYCAKILTVNEGKSGSYHYHKTKRETFLVLEGSAALVLGLDEHWAKVIVMEQGDRYHIPAMTHHLLLGLPKGPAQVLEVSTHHSDDDVVRLLRPSNDLRNTISNNNGNGTIKLL